MRSFLKSTFVWQFTAGFMLGAIGMVTMTPPDTFALPGAPTEQVAR